VKQAAAKAPLIGVAFYLALIVPLEFSVTLGGLRLSPYRVVLLLAFVPLLLRMVRENRLNAADYLITAHALWALLALCLYGGLASGIESGGIYIVESLGAYLVGRMAVTSPETSRAMLQFMLTVLALMAVFALPESLTGIHFLREASRAVMGGSALPIIEPRLGLHRSFGSFDHPILYGVFAASTFAAAYYVIGKERLKMRALAVLGLIAGSTFKGIQLRWSILIGGILLLWVAVTLASNRGFVKVFISYFTFSPQSAYNRTLIWDYGSAEVARNPLFGIGLGDWIRAPWMSDSMDNFWLLTAVRYGLPALMFLVGAIIYIGIKQAQMVSRDKDGVTVHFWNALFAYFFFLIGTGAWMTRPVTSHSKIMLLARLAASLPPQPVLRKQH
jgi:hypothetical protein